VLGSIRELKAQVDNMQNIINYMYFKEEKNNDIDNNECFSNSIEEVHTWWERPDGTQYEKITKHTPQLTLWNSKDYSYFDLNTYKGYINNYGHKIVSCYKQDKLDLFNNER
jgi:hypothetical protein